VKWFYIYIGVKKEMCCRKLGRHSPLCKGTPFLVALKKYTKTTNDLRVQDRDLLISDVISLSIG
jgi:hypothetical protein